MQSNSNITTWQWKDKINEWRNGYYQKYPNDIKKRFFYETSFCSKNFDSIYEENFIESNSLENIAEQNYHPYDEYIKTSNNVNAVAFPNLTGDTILVIPMPKSGKTYTTMKDFSDNAPESQQVEFWKLVANQIETYFSKEWLKTEKIYVSTHGLGVSYFHLRICSKPKYYHTLKFMK